MYKNTKGKRRHGVNVEMRGTRPISNWQIYTLNADFFMKSNKDVRATLCLGIYTTWRNKTYIVRGSQKSFHLGLSKRNLYWIAGLFLLRRLSRDAVITGKENNMKDN